MTVEVKGASKLDLFQISKRCYDCSDRRSRAPLQPKLDTRNLRFTPAAASFLRIISTIEPLYPAPTGKMAPPTKANGAGLAAAADESSPVLAQLQKRIRNLRKRLRNCEDIEAKKDAGKELNADQVCLRLVQGGSRAASNLNELVGIARMRSGRPGRAACPC